MLNEKINDLWNKLSPKLRRQVTTTPADDSGDQEIIRVEAELAAMKVQQDTLAGRLEKLQVENKAASNDVLQLEYARRDLQRSETVFDKIDANLSQLLYDAKNPVARMERDFEAQPTNRANADKRIQIMAASPIVTALAIVGMLVLLELRGGRVGDPDELASRMNLQVIGVVPPLPQVRTGGSAQAPAMNGQNGAGTQPSPSDLRAQRQLDEFVQSMDHLRVALCASRDPWGRDRHCVLITSACGSEGKTTLAAQLAERCVNANMMTLLIDADLRNPTLSRMLDASENPGLINVLRGEADAEDVIMVIGDAGGFHLLPAGNPRMDPSRLLQSERLGKLLAQARESFDMIIVDAPPVLPVPDALTIGRWTDGAVLAVRYDTSRFPLVERAYRRLSRVGVSVIGAVVNGVRSMESSYGGYYAYGYGSNYGSVYGDVGPGSGGHGSGAGAGATNGASPRAPAASTPKPSTVDD
jgi:capsular exopolysaccharide synthesis family protein